MNRWNARIPGPRRINEFAEGEVSAQQVARLYHAWIEAWLPRVRRWAEFRDVGLEEVEAVLDEFHTYAFVPSFSDRVEYLAAVLDALYDWADEQRVWIDPVNSWVLPADLVAS